jgi:hypothetical protein
MKRMLLIIAVLGLLAPPLAGAQRWGAPYGPGAQGQGPTRGEGGGRDYRGGREGRQPQRDERYERPPQRYERPPQRDERHQGRMTDEERRGLHQDLDRANREIYRPAPRR